MQNTTPKLIQVDEYNTLVGGWTIRTRRKFQQNAPVYSGREWKKRTTKKLQPSVTSATKKYGIEIGKIRFGFEDQGVFVHYGVGRGYIRQGNTVVRGSKKNEPVKSTGINRKQNDWFDVEIRRGMHELALIAQEYYGDWAMNKLLLQIDKYLIQKK